MGQGVSSAISWSAGLAWLTEATPTERRPAALGTAMAAGSTGALVGPVVGGPLGEHLGIRAPFVIFAVVAAALTVWAFFEPGARGRAEVVVGVRDLPRLAARNELIAATLLVTLIVAVVSGVTETLVPLHLGRARLLGRARSASCLGIAGVLGVLANVTCGRIYNRFGGIRIARTALLGAAVGTLGLAAAEADDGCLARLHHRDADDRVPVRRLLPARRRGRPARAGAAGSDPGRDQRLLGSRLHDRPGGRRRRCAGAVPESVPTCWPPWSAWSGSPRCDRWHSRPASAKNPLDAPPQTAMMAAGTPPLRVPTARV